MVLLVYFPVVLYYAGINGIPANSSYPTPCSRLAWLAREELLTVPPLNILVTIYPGATRDLCTIKLYGIRPKATVAVSGRE